MPIHFDVPVRKISRDEYHEIDYRVMGLAFEVQKELGRLHDEQVYQSELMTRCRQAGLSAIMEVPVRASLDTFSKTYFMDLLIEDSIDYELKCVESVSNAHRQQALNYMLMAGLSFGKIINFQTPRVQSEYVTTTLTAEDRFALSMRQDDWVDLSEDSSRFKDLLQRLLNEWGGFLDVQLYYDAVVHFMGGSENVLAPVKIRKDDKVLGTRSVHMLNSSEAFKITTLKMGLRQYAVELSLFLKHTSLEAFQWINMSGRSINFATLRNPSSCPNRPVI